MTTTPRDLAMYYTIKAAGVEEVGFLGKVFWIETCCHRRLDFYIKHRDGRIERIGYRAKSTLLAACRLGNVNDMSEFIGRSVHSMAWSEVRVIAAEQDVGEEKPTKSDGRFVYVISANDNDPPLCKIGIANSPEKRLKQLSTSSPHALRIELTRYSDNASAVERAAHSHFSDYRQNGEWFAIPPDQAITYIVEATRSAA